MNQNREPKGKQTGGQFAADVNPESNVLLDDRDAPASETLWKFNKNYHDHAQVDDLYPAYLKRRAELTERVQYHYNDLFKGHLGLDAQSDEDSAIYLCQSRYSLERHNEAVAEVQKIGAEYVKATADPVHYKKIIHAGFYMGGTGWKEYPDCRLLLKNGSVAVLPKGARSRGHYLRGGSILGIK